MVWFHNGSMKKVSSSFKITPCCKNVFACRKGEQNCQSATGSTYQSIAKTDSHSWELVVVAYHAFVMTIFHHAVSNFYFSSPRSFLEQKILRKEFVVFFQMQLGPWQRRTRGMTDIVKHLVIAVCGQVRWAQIVLDVARFQTPPATQCAALRWVSGRGVKGCILDEPSGACRPFRSHSDHVFRIAHDVQSVECSCKHFCTLISATTPHPTGTNMKRKSNHCVSFNKKLHDRNISCFFSFSGESLEVFLNCPWRTN